MEKGSWLQHWPRHQMLNLHHLPVFSHFVSSFRDRVCRPFPSTLLFWVDWAAISNPPRRCHPGKHFNHSKSVPGTLTTLAGKWWSLPQQPWPLHVFFCGCEGCIFCGCEVCHGQLSDGPVILLPCMSQVPLLATFGHFKWFTNSFIFSHFSLAVSTGKKNQTCDHFFTSLTRTVHLAQICLWQSYCVIALTSTMKATLSNKNPELKK